MIRAYDEMYVTSAQNILGHAVDFAVAELGVPLDTFGDAFYVSEVSNRFALGNPRYVAGMNGCELAREVLDRVYITYPDVEDVMYLDKSPEYWSGWALAFYQWRSGYSFADILTAVPLSRIVQMYGVYHEMDPMRFADDMDKLMREAHPQTRLAEKRENCGMSQSQLSEYSGVPLRQIQLFEQRRRDINKTAAETLYALSRALFCPMEELLERA